MPLPSAPGAGTNLPKVPGMRVTSVPEENTSQEDLLDFEEGWASVPSEEPETDSPLLSQTAEVVSWEEERAQENSMAKYVSVGSLTADQLINTPYEQFAHLEEKIAAAVQWVQDVMTEQNRSEDLVEARRDRGDKYDEMVRFLDGLILKYISRESVIRGEDRKILVASVINEILGLGPIEPLWSDDRVSEIMVNGPHRVRVEISGKLIDVKGARFRDREHLLSMCQQILGAVGRRIDNQHPLEDGRLADGSRVNVVHHVLAPKGPYLTIRRFPDTVFSMEKLVEFGSMTEEMAEEIGNLIFAGCSTVIVGGTGSGKTSFLNATSGCIPPGERIITVEDNLELRLHPSRDVSSLEARPASASGTGAVTIRDLVKNTLRMRPNRIVVGEVRDSSAYDMLQSMNTGHDGSLTTVHANDAVGGVERLVNLITEGGGFAPERALSLIAGGVDLFVVIDRFPEDGSRRVVGIYEIPNRVVLEEGQSVLRPIPLWEFVHDETLEDGKVIGHYDRINDPSDSLVRKHRLNRRRRLSIKEIYAMSSHEGDILDLDAHDLEETA